MTAGCTYDVLNEIDPHNKLFFHYNPTKDCSDKALCVKREVKFKL